MKKTQDKIYKTPFTVEFPDQTASGGVSKIKFLPWFDRIPSTGELVNTIERARAYGREVFKSNAKAES
jgi:hypothetical protein